MQPTFLPWAGYINLIASVDLFVFLDDAQYERASWQNRNRILVAGEATWLTVPVCRDQLGASLDKVWTDDKLQWRRKHLRTLEQAYARTPGRAEMMDIVHGLEGAGPSPLADLNISLLEAICMRLGVATPTMRSSQIALACRAPAPTSARRSPAPPAPSRERRAGDHACSKAAASGFRWSSAPRRRRVAG